MLTELQAKHVTPFARDEAATFESIFPGRARARERIDRAKRHDGHHPFVGNGHSHEATTADA